MPALAILTESEKDPEREVHATFGVGKYTLPKNSPEEAATFPKNIAIATRERAPAMQPFT